MSIISLKIVQRAVFATLVAASVAACSTIPGEQTASLPVASHPWVDASTLPAGSAHGDVFVSNGGDAN
jgi:hypothetical protein